MWVDKERRTHTDKQLQEFNGKGRDADEQSRMAFGKKLHSLASQARSTITNSVNPLWVPTASMRSGETLMSIVCAVREKSFFDEADRKAQLAAKQWANADANRNGNPNWKERSESDKITLIRERTDKSVFRYSQYDSWYLVFFLFGVPLMDCGHSRSYLLSTLSSGSAHSTSRQPPRGDSSAMVQNHMRSHSEASSVASGGSKDKATPAPEGPERRVVVVHDYARGSSASKLSLLQLRVSTLKDLYSLDPEDEDIKAKYRVALKAVADESEAMLSGMDVDGPTAVVAPASFNGGMLTASTKESLALTAQRVRDNGRPPRAPLAKTTPCACGKSHFVSGEPTFTCPICLRPLVSFSSTVCDVVGDGVEGEAWCSLKCRDIARGNGQSSGAKRKRDADDEERAKELMVAWQEKVGLYPLECGGGGDCGPMSAAFQARRGSSSGPTWQNGSRTLPTTL